MGLSEKALIAPLAGATLRTTGPCAGGLAAVNAIVTQLRDLVNSGLARWRLTVYVDAVAESGRNPVRKHQIDD